jgi:hypothetical protein
MPDLGENWRGFWKHRKMPYIKHKIEFGGFGVTGGARQAERVASQACDSVGTFYTRNVAGMEKRREKRQGEKVGLDCGGLMGRKHEASQAVQHYSPPSASPRKAASSRRSPNFASLRFFKWRTCGADRCLCRTGTRQTGSAARVRWGGPDSCLPTPEKRRRRAGITRDPGGPIRDTSGIVAIRSRPPHGSRFSRARVSRWMRR